MAELRLCCWKGTLSSCIEVQVGEEVTCRELVNQLITEGELEEKQGAWHLVERWNGCERRLQDGDRVVEAVRRWGCVEGRVGLRCEAVTSVRSGGVKRGSRRRVDDLRAPITNRRLSRLCHGLKQLSTSVCTQASTLWLQRLARQQPTSGGCTLYPLESCRQRLAELKKKNLRLSTVISRLNIRASELSGELNSLKAEESELSESVRSVEEDVRGWRREREWESRSGMADLQAEIIRLKRELESRNRLNSAQSSKLQSLEAVLAQKRRHTVAESHDHQLTEQTGGERVRGHGQGESAANPPDPLVLLPAKTSEEQKLLTVPQADAEWYRCSHDNMSYRDKIDQVLGGEDKGHHHGNEQDLMGGDFISEVMSSFERRHAVGGAGDIQQPA